MRAIPTPGGLEQFVLGYEQDPNPSYELECLSPALFLKPGEQFCHISRTWHLLGDAEAIADIGRRHFFTSPDDLAMFEQQTHQQTVVGG